MSGLPEKSREQRRLEEEYFDAEFSHKDEYVHNKKSLGSGWLLTWDGGMYFGQGDYDWYPLKPEKDPRKRVTTELASDFNTLILRKLTAKCLKKASERPSLF